MAQRQLPSTWWFALVGVAMATSGCDGELEIAGGDHIPGFERPGETPGSNSGNNNPIHPGLTPRPSLHRLNQLEYNNTVRDLLGTELRPANDFPPDASIDGFDNIAEALSITPTLMDRYVSAARLVVEDAFADRPSFQDVFEEDDARLTFTVDRESNSIGGIIRLRGGNAAGEVDVPAAGPHTVVLRTQGVRNGTAAAPRMRVTVAGQDLDFDVPMTMQDTTFAMELPQGRHAIALVSLNFEENAAENRGNDILFDRLTIRSDERVEGPARTRILTCDLVADETTCASNVIHTFARRAWRRPLDPAERASLDELYTTVRAEGETAEDALKLVLRALLSSPKFLYRYRMIDDSDSEMLLDPFVLASRLSFFIWSSTPDDRLLDAAENGTLSSLEGIRTTVAWMLADERASALADGFAEQWLDLRHLEQASPSPEIFPEFNDAVRAAMKEESRLFFLDYLSNNAPVASMLQPAFTYRNNVLAIHLGLTPPEGDGFQRIAAAPGDRRGVLALNAWLTARSDTEHSSPIRRGSWVADNMLCTPVPPPPAGLEIGELAEAESGLTMRQRLEMHRNDPACSACHAYLDVVGMGFEVYDGIGRHIDEPTLDSLGELPGLGEFRGADEMANLMDKEVFVTCVSRKLFSYALGRTAEFSEVDELDGPTAVTLTLPDLVTAIATSPAFSQPAPLE